MRSSHYMSSKVKLYSYLLRPPGYHSVYHDPPVVSSDSELVLPGDLFHLWGPPSVSEPGLGSYPRSSPFPGNKRSLDYWAKLTLQRWEILKEQKAFEFCLNEEVTYHLSACFIVALERLVRIWWNFRFWVALSLGDLEVIPTYAIASSAAVHANTAIVSTDADFLATDTSVDAATSTVVASNDDAFLLLLLQDNMLFLL